VEGVYTSVEVTHHMGKLAQKILILGKQIPHIYTLLFGFLTPFVFLQ
jgi:hypothetical protein